MRTHRLTQVLALSISALLLTACINGTPGNSGNSSVKRNTPAVAANDGNQSNPQQAGSDQTQSNVAPTVPNPVVNVYLETSGSMNGYVNGGTSIFQQVVKEYLSGINNANFASAVNYNYINSKIIPRGNDLDQYITKLTPQSFSSQGNTATTDIGGIFKTILDATDNNTISIFISDCIISPGRNNNPQAYARGQMTDVRDAIVGYVNKYQDLACMVYQFDSGFKGTYYDYLNTAHRNIDMERPFYIWVFGHTAQVAMLKLKHVPDRDFRIAPIRNQWFIFNTPLAELQPENKYGLLLSTGAQNGNYTRVNATTARGIQRYGEGYRFSFGAYLGTAEYLMGSDYIEDTDNYVHLVNKATKQEFYGVIEKDEGSTSPYTNIFRVESQNPFQKGPFTLAFIPKVPKWVEACNDDDDRTFNGSNNNKTYGIINIFNGVYNGFNSGNHDNILAQFDFEIK